MDIGLRRYFTYGFRRENSKDSFGVCVRPKGAYSGGRGRRRIGGVGASGRFRTFREPACGGVFVQYHLLNAAIGNALLNMIAICI